MINTLPGTGERLHTSIVTAPPYASDVSYTQMQLIYADQAVVLECSLSCQPLWQQKLQRTVEQWIAGECSGGDTTKK